MLNLGPPRSDAYLHPSRSRAWVRRCSWRAVECSGVVVNMAQNIAEVKSVTYISGATVDDVVALDGAVVA